MTLLILVYHYRLRYYSSTFLTHFLSCYRCVQLYLSDCKSLSPSGRNGPIIREMKLRNYLSVSDWPMAGQLREQLVSPHLSLLLRVFGKDIMHTEMCSLLLLCFLLLE